MLSRLFLRPACIGTVYLAFIPLFALVYFLNPEFWGEPLTLIQSLYFSTVTITTLGYGDIAPKTETARILTSTEAIFGIVTIGLFLNAVARRASDIQEGRRKEALRDHLLAQYQEWREDMVDACLRAAAGGYGTDLERSKEFAEFQRFREHFTGKSKQRWYDVLNGLQENEKFLQDILAVSDLFSQQVNYALGNIQSENSRAIGTLTRVAQRPYLLKNLDVYSGDPVKYIGQYAFEILGMYSVIDGSLDEDFIENAIRSL